MEVSTPHNYACRDRDWWHVDNHGRVHVADGGACAVGDGGASRTGGLARTATPNRDACLHVVGQARATPRQMRGLQLLSYYCL